ncbi:hypothetical protein R6Q57_002861 [Mikania cordata]
MQLPSQHTTVHPSECHLHIGQKMHPSKMSIGGSLMSLLMASDEKTFVFDDVSKHNKADDCWLIISGKVYDVTPFMDEHPGGAEVLLSSTGKDGTTDFENTGHSDEAKQQMGKYYIGEIDQLGVPLTHSNIARKTSEAITFGSNPTQELMAKILKFLVPFMILVMAFIAFK